MHRYETTVTLPDGTKLGSDYPKLGYNAEAYVITVNMDLINGAYVDPVLEKVLTIDKVTQKLYDVDVDVGSTAPVYAMAPATMHGAPPGSPLYAVRETTRFGGDSVRVIAMTDLLSDHPTFTEYVIPIFPYTKPPKAVHPPNKTIETFESFFLNADWRDNRLVATFHIGLAGDSVVHVAWFDFDTSGAVPVLTQSGIIDQGPDVHTYYSAIAVAANGDLGLTFMESSATEPISMYVTGQPAFAYGTGKMVPPVAVAVGQENYSGGRGGDYAGMAVDPEMGNVFWAANEYKPDGALNLWGTRIASFVLERDAAMARLTWPLTDGLRIGPSDNLSAMRVPTAGAPTAAAVAPVPEASTVDPVVTTTASDRSFMVRIGLHSSEAFAADEWSAVLDSGAWSLGGRRQALALGLRNGEVERVLTPDPFV
jgi:hypothetical protein